MAASHWSTYAGTLAIGAGFLLATGCGTGGFGGSALSGDYIAPPPGPVDSLAGDYVQVVEQPLGEHTIDDEYFFLSAFNWTVGDTTWVEFEANGQSNGLWASSALTFANSTTDNTHWTATDNGTIEYAAPYEYLHDNGLEETFDQWGFAGQWAAVINPGVNIAMSLNIIASSDTSQGTTDGTLWDASLWGFGYLPDDLDVASQGNGTVATAHYTLWPRPTSTELGPYAGNYAVQGLYEEFAGAERQEVSFNFTLAQDGTISTSLTGSTIFYAFLKPAGIAGTVITAQSSGPAIQGALDGDDDFGGYYDWWYWWYGSWYEEEGLYAPPPQVAPASSPFNLNFTLDQNDKVTQKIELTVDSTLQVVNGGLLQQSINIFPDETMPNIPHDRQDKVTRGPRIEFIEVSRN